MSWIQASGCGKAWKSHKKREISWQRFTVHLYGRVEGKHKMSIKLLTFCRQKSGSPKMFRYNKRFLK